MAERYLKYVGHDIYGYIADHIIGRLKSNVLPGVVEDILRRQLDHNFFVIADLTDLVSFFDRLPRLTMFSGKPGSAFLGLNSND